MTIDRRRGVRGAIALEYILTAAAVALLGASAAPFAMRLLAYLFEVVYQVVASPFPAGL